MLEIERWTVTLVVGVTETTDMVLVTMLLEVADGDTIEKTSMVNVPWTRSEQVPCIERRRC